METERSTAEAHDAAHALARSAIYRVLSELSLYPRSAREGAKGQLTECTAALDAAGGVLAEAGYGEPVRASLAELGCTCSAEHAGRTADEYVRVFGHTVSKVCPPYESHYGAPHIFGQTTVLADLAGCYEAFGLQVRRDAGERLDHVSVELEFMYVLTYKEAHALEHHGAERADLCRDAQRVFLRDHLATWVDDFSTRLARQAARGLYASYADALRRYVAAELVYLGLRHVESETLEPQSHPGESCTMACGPGSQAPVGDPVDITAHGRSADE